jgi:hypothetical protein
MATVEEMLAGIKKQQAQTSSSVLSIEEMLNEINNPKEPEADERGILERAGDWFKGNQKEANIPLAYNAGLGLPKGKATAMLALLTTTNDPARLESGIKNIIPNAEAQTDSFGNLVIASPVYRDGKATEQFTRFYPNPKGLDVTNLMQISGALGLAKGLTKGYGLLSQAPTGYKAAAAIGATEAGLVELGSSQMADDDFKFSDLVYGAGGGAAGQAVAQLGTRIAKLFKSNPKSVLDEYGNIKPEIAEQMRKAGLDPEQAREEMAAAMNQQVRQGVDVDEAARIAEAGTLPVPVPLTKGQVTGDKGQQLFEDSVRSGAYGESSAGMLNDQAASAQQSLQQNVDAIQQRVAGDSPVISRAEGFQGGQAVSDALNTQFDAAKKTANDLYSTARQSGPAFVDEGAGSALLKASNDAISENFELANMPKTSVLLSSLTDIMSEKGGSIRDLFAWRQKVASQIADGGAEGVAASKLKQVFNDQMADSFERSLISGDQEAVKAWSNAVSNYADFAATWKSKSGILKALTEKTVRDGESVLKVTPEGAANYILGANNSKLIRPGEILDNIDTLKKMLPTSEWNQIRQEAFINLFSKGDAATKSGDDIFSGVKLRAEWKKLMKANPTAIKALFTQEERNLIDQFANVAARATGGEVNASNSANSAFNLIGRIAAALGSSSAVQIAGRLPLMDQFVTTPLLKAYGAGATANALKASPTPAPIGMLPGAGGAAAQNQDNRNLIDERIQSLTGLQPSAF